MANRWKEPDSLEQAVSDIRELLFIVTQAVSYKNPGPWQELLKFIKQRREGEK